MELYTPSLKLLPVFRCSGHDKSSLLALPEVRKAVRHYVEVNDLQSKDNPRLGSTALLSVYGWHNHS